MFDDWIEFDEQMVADVVAGNLRQRLASNPPIAMIPDVRMIRCFIEEEIKNPKPLWEQYDGPVSTYDFVDPPCACLRTMIDDLWRVIIESSPESLTFYRPEPQPQLDGVVAGGRIPVRYTHFGTDKWGSHCIEVYLKEPS